MGRIFEKRKHKMFARWAKMAKAFTRVGKDISMAAKRGGPDPNTNAQLRIAIQNAKAINMPKANIESAIQRATNKDMKDYEEMVYEGYGPHAVAVVVETATDNPTRTVANVRHCFTRVGASLGKTGSLEFLFERKGVFEVVDEGQDLEELELELIDSGLEEIDKADGKIYIYTAFTDFGNMQKALEERGIQVSTASLERIPTNQVELNDEQRAEVQKMLDYLEEDDDVQAVFHNMKED
ncbi:MAG: YebC/PmpR family DNA-binding transcriptional regulator [Flavobacteriales bacterium]|nr:YebC/PmpR family DNA-binding transcriptional regulator [Flavobacteriales bacterium]MCB9448491.1 YebC/PmpR family DNA-binding transcriptional regulator [Flavobacteriales bacterium]